MEDIDVPRPNPALAQILVGPRVRSMVFEVGEIAQALYRATGHKDSGRSARDARVSTHIGGVDSDRWVSTLTVNQPTSTRRALDDLNHVLNQLGAL